MDLLTQTSSFGFFEGGALFLSLVGTILYVILAYVLFRRPVKKHPEKVVTLTALAFLLYFIGNFLALFPRTIIFDMALNFNRLGWIITLLGISGIPASLIHAYGTYYFETRVGEKQLFSIRTSEIIFSSLHLTGLFFFVGFFLFTSEQGSLRMVDMSSTGVRIFFEAYAAWVGSAILIAAVFSLKLSVIPHWERYKSYFYINGIILIFVAIVVFISFWDLRIVSFVPEAIRFIFLFLTLVHGIILGYYRIQKEFINIFVRPSLVYFTLAGLIVLVYQFGIRNFTEFLSQYPTVNVEFIELILLLGLIFLFQPARVQLQERINALFFQESRKFQESVHTISQQLKASINLDTLFLTISNQLKEILEVSIVIIVKPEMAEYAGLAVTGKYLSTATDPVISRDTKHAEIELEFAKTNLELVVAIREEKGSILGILGVGGKQLYKSFTGQDMHFIKTIANQLAVYIKNATLIEDQISMERLMLKQDNLSSLGQIAASITHEVKNPLSAINTLVQVMQEEMPEGEELTSSLVTIENEIEYLNRILSEIVKYSDPESDHRRLVSVTDVLEGIVVLLRTEARLNDVELVLATDQDYFVSGTLQELKKIFFNLIFNAIHACRKNGGRVELATRELEGFVEVMVMDSGIGLPESETIDIFEPYYTTKSDGVGLGLSIVKENVTNMNGFISARNRPEGGAEFAVRLPMAVEE